MWDLQRNGGNVQMTTERILGGRGLETVSFPKPRGKNNSAAAGDKTLANLNVLVSLHQVSSLFFQKRRLRRHLQRPRDRL
jgi:hypothetical protein